MSPEEAEDLKDEALEAAIERLLSLKLEPAAPDTEIVASHKIEPHDTIIEFEVNSYPRIATS